jgi:hypothetical protein
MWYLGYRWQAPWASAGLPKIMNLCYAESDDGVHWHKPNLGLVEHHGSRSNNLVAVNVSNPTVIEDPRDPDPARRFKVFRHGVEPGIGNHQEAMGHYVAFSPDGLNLGEWRRIIPRCGDRHTFMYDPSLPRPWVCFTRPPDMWSFKRRMVARTDSEDCRHWGPAEPILVPDLDDPVDCQFYGLCGFPYSVMYLGFLQRMFAVEDRLDVELVWSRDSREWHRSARRPAFLSPGPEGSWKSKWVGMAHNPPLDVDGALLLYYEGRNLAHYGIVPGVRMEIGLASMYRDRFVSISAGPFEGELRTRPFVCPGGRLWVNVNTCATTGADYTAHAHGPGYALCEVLDEAGGVVPGFGREACERFWDDCRRGRAIRWGERDHLDTLKGRTIRLRFLLVESDLYSFWFESAEAAAGPHHRAAGQAVE